MKLEVENIKILEGQFRVLSPEEALHAPKDGELPRGTLMVGCKFALMSGGNVIAEGTASNIPGASGTRAILSATTLKSFEDFFNSLEHDIANAMAITPAEAKEQKNVSFLEEVMGKRR